MTPTSISILFKTVLHYFLFPLHILGPLCQAKKKSLFYSNWYPLTKFPQICRTVMCNLKNRMFFSLPNLSKNLDQSCKMGQYFRYIVGYAP